MWIGGKGDATAVDLNFVWATSGNYINYTNWFRSSPKLLTGLTCLSMYGFYGEWTNVPCGDAYGPIYCEVVYNC